jgi:hypothetical protein
LASGAAGCACVPATGAAVSFLIASFTDFIRCDTDFLPDPCTMATFFPRISIYGQSKTGKP